MAGVNSALRFDTPRKDSVDISRPSATLEEVRVPGLSAFAAVKRALVVEGGAGGVDVALPQEEELPLQLNSLRWYARATGEGSQVKYEKDKETDSSANVGSAGLDLGPADTPEPTVSATGAPLLSPLTRWRQELDHDVSLLAARGRRRDLYQLVQSILLQIHSAEDGDDGRRSGTDINWVAPNVANIASLSVDGYVPLRDIRNFDRGSTMDAYWSMGVSLPLSIPNHMVCADQYQRLMKLHGNEVSSPAVAELVLSLATWIAIGFLSDSPHLWTTIGGFILDDITSRLHASRSDPDLTGDIGLLQTVADFGEAAFIGAAVGARTSVSRFCLTWTKLTLQQAIGSKSQTITWLKGLLYPEACLKLLPFGSGAALECVSCFQSHTKIETALGDPTSGLSGRIRSVVLQDRISIGTYGIRRGLALSYVRSVGRTAVYDCLASFLYYYFHHSFIIIFLYFSTMIHMRDKAGRGKYVVYQTDQGYALSSF